MFQNIARLIVPMLETTRQLEFIQVSLVLILLYLIGIIMLILTTYTPRELKLFPIIRRYPLALALLTLLLTFTIVMILLIS